jgi:hypothetical protein
VSGLRARDVVFNQYIADLPYYGDSDNVVLILAAQLESFPRTPIGTEANPATESARLPVRSSAVPRSA